MTGTDRLSSAAPIGFANSPASGGDARSLAGGAIGEIGCRLLAWVRASGGAADAATWPHATDGTSDFRPDASRLAQRGDIYDFDGLASAVAGRTGATLTQEGDLRRAFADFARAAVVQVAGLSGAPGDRQVAGVEAAFGAAVDGGSAAGVVGVIERLDRATAALTLANGS